MPGTPTTKYGIATLTGADLVKNGPTALNGSLTTIDGLLAPSDQGLFTSRPTSTGGNPGKIGRTYKSTDGNGGESLPRFFRDNGTGWDEIPFAAQQAWQTLAVTNAVSLSYMKDSLGFVHLRRDPWVFTSTTVINTVLATLPVGYRPVSIIYGVLHSINVISDANPPVASSSFSIRTDGKIYLESGQSVLASAGSLLGYVPSLDHWRGEN